MSTNHRFEHLGYIRVLAYCWNVSNTEQHIFC